MKKVILAASAFVLAIAQSALCSTSAYLSEDNLWETTNIPVCWESDGFATEKNWVKEAIQNSWEQNSVVRFTGWGACPQVQYAYKNQSSGIISWIRDAVVAPVATIVEFGIFQGIRIGIEDAADRAPHTIGLGKGIMSKKNGMVLNLSFNNWSSGCASEAIQANGKKYRENCVQNVAIHEFGHALGFAHEQDSPLSQCHITTGFWEGLARDVAGDQGTVIIGKYDAVSAMNYCQDWDGFRIRSVSSGDIAGVNWAYPGVLSPPEALAPQNGAAIFTRKINLSWKSSSPYSQENISYDVYLAKEGGTVNLVSSGQSATTLQINNLDVNSRYYWKIMANRSYSVSRYGKGFVFDLFHNSVTELVSGPIYSVKKVVYDGDILTLFRSQNPTPLIENGGFSYFDVKPPVVASIIAPLLLN